MPQRRARRDVSLATKRTLAAALASLLLLSGAVPQTADACLHPVRLAGNKAVKAVAGQDAKLAAGKHAALLGDAFRIDVADGDLRLRVQLLMAVAAMRDGRKDVPPSYWEMTERTTDEPDRSPLARLRGLKNQMGDTPVLDARIAEALLRSSREAKIVAEAKVILDDLVARDVMPDAEAWASLALARSLTADTAGRDAALATCKKTAKKSRRAAVCKVSIPTS